MSLLPDRPYQLPCYHWHFLGTFQPLPGEYITRVCGSDRRKLFSAPLPCENTKPKTSFVEPQGTKTPNHFSSKPFARHTNTNQPRRMVVFQSFRMCYFQHYFLLFSALVTHLSQAIQSKASWMQRSIRTRKLYSKGMPRHSVTETPFWELYR